MKTLKKLTQKLEEIAEKMNISKVTYINVGWDGADFSGNYFKVVDVESGRIVRILPGADYYMCRFTEDYESTIEEEVKNEAYFLEELLNSSKKLLIEVWNRPAAPDYEDEFLESFNFWDFL